MKAQMLMKTSVAGWIRIGRELMERKTVSMTLPTGTAKDTCNACYQNGIVATPYIKMTKKLLSRAQVLSAVPPNLPKRLSAIQV